MPTITIDVTNAQAQRIATAYGKAYLLGRDATVAEVRQYLIAYMKSVVTDTERAAAQITDLGVT